MIVGATGAGVVTGSVTTASATVSPSAGTAAPPSPAFVATAVSSGETRIMGAGTGKPAVPLASASGIADGGAIGEGTTGIEAEATEIRTGIAAAAAGSATTPMGSAGVSVGKAGAACGVGEAGLAACTSGTVAAVSITAIAIGSAMGAGEVPSPAGTGSRVGDTGGATSP